MKYIKLYFWMGLYYVCLGLDRLVDKLTKRKRNFYK